MRPRKSCSSKGSLLPFGCARRNEEAARLSQNSAITVFKKAVMEEISTRPRVTSYTTNIARPYRGRVTIFHSALSGDRDPTAWRRLVLGELTEHVINMHDDQGRATDEAMQSAFREIA